MPPGIPILLFHPYSGKPTEEKGQYYIQGTEAIVNYLIETLSTNSSLAGRNISFDRLKKR